MTARHRTPRLPRDSETGGTDGGERRILKIPLRRRRDHPDLLWLSLDIHHKLHPHFACAIAQTSTLWIDGAQGAQQLRRDVRLTIT